MSARSTLINFKLCLLCINGRFLAERMYDLTTKITEIIVLNALRGDVECIVYPTSEFSSFYCTMYGVRTPPDCSRIDSFLFP